MKLLLREATFTGNTCDKAEDFLVWACWEFYVGGLETDEQAAFLAKWTVLLGEDGLLCHETLAYTLDARNVNWSYKGAWEDGWCNILIWYFRVLPESTSQCFRRTLENPKYRPLAFDVLSFTPEFYPDFLYERTHETWVRCVEEADLLDGAALDGLAGALATLSAYDERPAKLIQGLRPFAATMEPEAAASLIRHIEYAERHSNLPEARRPFRKFDEEETPFLTKYWQ